MPAPGWELREIHWTEAFPFLRLFRAFGRAKRPSRLFVALAAILVVYLAGRGLDWIWMKGSWGLSNGSALVLPGGAGTNVGPFKALMNFERESVSQLLTSAAGGSIRGAAVSGLLVMSGPLRLLIERPLFSLLFLMIALLAFALACGAIARQVALEDAIDEHISMGEALRFAKSKWPELVFAPGFVLVAFLALVVVLALAGVVTAIPWLGEILVGFLLPLGLLIGFALALAFLAGLFGFSLMWPTIAVEGSDHFDAVSRACSYVGRRPWHLAFFSVVSLLYGGLCLLTVRVIAMLTLKLTHAGLALGLAWVGAHNGATPRVTKLDRMWSMPGWDNLPWLPLGGPFYGDFFTADLHGAERFAGFLICAWVFAVVGMVIAFGVSLWVCSSVQMYFLLRRSVDRAEYNEVFFEGPTRLTQGESPEKPGDGVALPVLNG